MKRLIYVGAFLFLGAIALSSCKKDWVCMCGDETPDQGYIIHNKTKNKAKKACEGSVNIGFISGGGDSSCYVQ